MKTKMWLATSIAVIATATCGVWLGLSSTAAGAQAISATVVTSNAATVSTGGTLVFTATVTSAGLSVGAVGAVAWTGVTCTTTTALTAGVATCSIANAQAGTAYTATANYTARIPYVRPIVRCTRTGLATTCSAGRTHHHFPLGHL